MYYATYTLPGETVPHGHVHRRAVDLYRATFSPETAIYNVVAFCASGDSYAERKESARAVTERALDMLIQSSTDSRTEKIVRTELAKMWKRYGLTREYDVPPVE